MSVFAEFYSTYKRQCGINLAKLDKKRGKMKKRLRKKYHVEEFARWGRQLVILLKRNDGLDEFLDVFIEMIESTGCYCGGGGKENKLSIVVALGRRCDDPDAKMKKIAAWLDARTDVQSWKMGEEFDVWQGDYTDIDDAIEPQGTVS
jgi:uncharacterized protein YggL (DUF469 family)